MVIIFGKVKSVTSKKNLRNRNKKFGILSKEKILKMSKRRIARPAMLDLLKTMVVRS